MASYPALLILSFTTLSAFSYIFSISGWSFVAHSSWLHSVASQGLGSHYFSFALSLLSSFLPLLFPFLLSLPFLLLFSLLHVCGMLVMNCSGCSFLLVTFWGICAYWDQSTLHYLQYWRPWPLAKPVLYSGTHSLKITFSVLGLCRE